MKILQNNLPESEFLECPEPVSPAFVLGMIATSVITLTILAIPALVMYLLRELKTGMKATISG